jgi:uncharacterized protein
MTYVLGSVFLAGCQLRAPLTSPTPVDTVTIVAGATGTPLVEPTPTVSWTTETVSFVTAAGRRTQLTVEVADTPTKRGVGLSGRATLPPDRGMLFIFDRPGGYEFWMRDTTLPLSIAFADDTGVILDLQDLTPLSDERHRPARDYQYALEVNRSYFQQQGIHPGDRLLLPGQTG